MALVAQLVAAAECPGRVFDVGPASGLQSIASVPWRTLKPCDQVAIHWRPEPYREKWVINSSGRPDAWIIVRGVPGPKGEKPVIDGNGAVTPPGLSATNEERGLVKIGLASHSRSASASYVTVEGLELRGASPDNWFTASDGSRRRYADNAASVFIDAAENVGIRDCIIHDSGNGIFVGSLPGKATREIEISRNLIFGNGVVGSGLQHNTYTEAAGIRIVANDYGPLRKGADGHALKDRSAGLLVDSNRFEGGSRSLDLVNPGSDAVLGDAAWGETIVRNNLFIKPASEANNQFIHFGGETAAENRHRGRPLTLVNNTFVAAERPRAVLIWLSDPHHSAVLENNILYTAGPGSTLSLLFSGGTIAAASNCIKPGWRLSSGGAGTVTGEQNWIETDSPGFSDEAQGDYSLRAGSPCAPMDKPLGVDWDLFQSRRSVYRIR